MTFTFTELRFILSWTTKKHKKILSRLLHSKLKKIQALFKDLHRNLRTFQGKMEFKDFSRTSPKIQGLFKTVRTLVHFANLVSKEYFSIQRLIIFLLYE